MEVQGAAAYVSLVADTCNRVAVATAADRKEGRGQRERAMAGGCGPGEACWWLGLKRPTGHLHDASGHLPISNHYVGLSVPRHIDRHLGNRVPSRIPSPHAFRLSTALAHSTSADNEPRILIPVLLQCSQAPAGTQET